MSNYERSPYKVIRPWSWKMRRHWITKVMVLLLPLAALVFLAPAIVANTPLLGMIARSSLGKFSGDVTIGSASLGWFSPVVINNLAVTNDKGEPVASVESIRSEKTLLSLALDQRALGLFRIEQPSLNLVLRDNGSNLEDLIASFPPSSSKSPSPQVSLEIVEGNALLTAAASGKKWQASRFTAKLAAATADTPLSGECSCTLTDELNASSELKAQVAIQPPANGPANALGAGQASVQCAALPAALIETITRRFAADVQLAGQLAGEFAFSWKENGAEQWLEIVSGQIQNFALASPTYIGPDRIAIPQIGAGGKLGLVGDRIVIDRASLVSNLGKVSLSGATRLENVTRQSSAIAEALLQEDFQLAGEIDMAQLARLLPNTLRLRNDSEITSGQVEFNLTSQAQGSARVWQGRIGTTNLEALVAGRRVTWDQPISATLSGQKAADGSLSADANCRSSFLSTTAHLTPARGDIKAEGDLDKLAEQLRQFVDLGALKMQGRLVSDIHWQPQTNQRVELVGSVTSQNFAVSAPGFKPWKEDRLQLDLSATGEANLQGVQLIDSAKAELVSAGDRLVLDLLQPIRNVGLSTAWPLKVHLGGDLESWAARLQPLVDLSAWEMAGRVECTAQAQAASQRIAFEKMNAQIDKLQLHGQGLFLDEPLVKLETTALLDLTTQTFSSPVTTLAAAAIAFRADNLSVHFAPQKFSVSGDVAFRGDMARLAAWMNDPRQPITSQWFGALEGSAKVAYADGASQGVIDAKIDNLAYATRAAPNAAPVAAPNTAVAASLTSGGWNTVWHEPKLTLRGAARHAAAQDSLDLNDFVVESPALRLLAKGKIAQLSGQQKVDLSGTVDYDWQNVVERLRGYLGPNVQVSGRESRTFAIRGPLFAPNVKTGSAAPTPVGLNANAPSATPLFPQDLTAEAGFGWTAIQAYGLALGKGEVAGKLERGAVRVTPIDLAVSGGQVKAAPWIDLNASPYILRHDRGPIAENLKISPEMCQMWLKYVAPLMADVTRAEGTFSLNLDGAAVPLANPYGADVAGNFVVHGAQIGPGPLAEQFVALAQQVKALVEKKPLGGASSSSVTWIAIPKHDVPFRVTEGRVYHQRLQFQIRDVVIATTGSVGIDQSLSMTAEVPILDQWVGSDRYLASLRGQTLRIPVGGTLSKPQLDWRSLGDLAKQMAGSAARGALEGEIQRGLNRFLPQQPPGPAASAAPGAAPAAPTNSPLPNTLEEGLLRGLNRFLPPSQPPAQPAP